MFYPWSAVERAMRIQEVLLQAIGGKKSWLEAAEILEVTPRTIRRWKTHFERAGFDVFFDRRRQHPSPKRVPLKVIEQVLTLYRERYRDFHVKHFHEKLVEEHGIHQSYTWVKTVLQNGGLVARRSRRTKHRRRRARRPLPGMLLHLDGSKHCWMPLLPAQKDDLLVLMDDATNYVYGALLVDEENTQTVMQVLRDCLLKHGLFCALYTDRASHFAYTPSAGGAVDKSRPTQVGRALKQLGIQHILAYSPQARGRSERLFGTWQNRLPQELRLAGIQDRDSANQFLRRRFIPWHNKHLVVAPGQDGTAFTSLVNPPGLDQVLCLEHTRIVANDNTVTYGTKTLQIDAVPWRFSFARSEVTVREHLDSHLSLWYGPKLIGRYDAHGQPLSRARRTAKTEVA